MQVRLDGQGTLHSQVKRALKGALTAGLLTRGARLPPTRLLARELGVSRNTVLTAYAQLQAEGYLNARIGSGSYALPPPASSRSIRDNRLAVCDPQSEFSARCRQFHRPASRLPGSWHPRLPYSFQYGLPLVNYSLTTAWGRELAWAASYTSPNYPNPQGLKTLREGISDYLVRRRGIVADPDEILIVNGTQQAMSLTARVILDPGNAVAIEDPQYLAIRRVLGIHGATLLPIPVDADGLCCHELPPEAPKLVCVSPSHQFPTGSILSEARRLQLLDYAKRAGTWIFEDDYDGEFTYEPQPLPPLRSIDKWDRVIYCGTFSKSLFPSLRIGYMVLPAALREDFITAKWADDFGSSPIEQAALARFMSSGAFDRHLRRSTTILRDRRNALLEALQSVIAPAMQVTGAHAGMHVAVWLPSISHHEMDILVNRTANDGVGIHPIRPYYMDQSSQPGLLLGYCGLSSAQIRAGVRILNKHLIDLA